MLISRFCPDRFLYIFGRVLVPGDLVIDVHHVFMRTVEHERFLHLHGEQAARLDADQSIHPERDRTFLMKILSPVLLYGPDIHLRQLEAASVDSLVAIRRWTALLEQLTNEWKEFTLYVCGSIGSSDSRIRLDALMLRYRRLSS